MTKPEIISLIQSCLTTLANEDEDLLLNKPREEAVNGTLADYIRVEIRRVYGGYYRVDTEYDTDRGQNKRVPIRGIMQNIRPDIIVHQRTHNDENFLAIEAKLNNTNQNDWDKVVGLMQPPYDYKYGALISYFPNRDFYRFSIFYHYRGWIWEQIFDIQKHL